MKRKLLYVAAVVWVALFIWQSYAHAYYDEKNGEDVIRHYTKAEALKTNGWSKPYLGVWCLNGIDSYTKPNSEHACKAQVTIRESQLVFENESREGATFCDVVAKNKRFDPEEPLSTHSVGNIIVHIRAHCEYVWGDESDKSTRVFELSIYKARMLRVKEIPYF